jgi:archaemetzincin
MTDICLVPVKFSNTSFLRRIQNELNRKFRSSLNVLNLEYDIEKTFSKERGQYYSSQIIADISQFTGKETGKVLLITDADLYVPVLTFVFGEAQLNGKHSIISVCRLHEEFYSEVSDDELLIKRTMKEVLHELGHNFGLLHCIDWDCVMHSSQGIEEVDIKGKFYCKECAKHIDSLKQ